MCCLVSIRKDVLSNQILACAARYLCLPCCQTDGCRLNLDGSGHFRTTSHTDLTTAHLATTSSLWRSSAETLSGSSFLMSTKSSSTDCRTTEKQSRPLTKTRQTSQSESTMCLNLLPSSHLSHFIRDAVTQLSGHAQVDPELVELRCGLYVRVDVAEVLLHVGWADLRL